VSMVLLITNGDSDSVGQWVWRSALCGVGFGLFQAPNNHAILSAAPASRSGSASGMMGTARLTGQALGAVVTALIFNALPAGLQATRGVSMCLALGAVLALVAAACSSMRLVAPARAG
jgi:DHA2 family multidrug resistance protein-like MFS transporter